MIIQSNLSSQKSWFLNILVLEQFSSQPSCSQEKCLGCLTKLQVSILYLTTLSRWYLYDQSRISKVTKDLVFEQIASQTVFQNELWIKFENWGSTVYPISLPIQENPNYSATIICLSDGHNWRVMIPNVRMWRNGNAHALLVGCKLLQPLWKPFLRYLRKLNTYQQHLSAFHS